MSGELNSIRSKTLFHAFQNVNKKTLFIEIIIDDIIIICAIHFNIGKFY